MARKRSRRPPPATLARRWSVVIGVAIVAYLYYHPLRAYFATRHDRAAVRSEVAQLTAQKRELRRRLGVATSTDALAREARELGYVRPGEHLFIVKGIPAWERAHSTLARHGR
jgi:cell division protein FtsB